MMFFLLENFIDKFDYVNVNEFREDKNNRDACREDNFNEKIR